MRADLARRQSPTEAALLRRREELAAVRSALAEHELALADLRAELKTFEGRYLRQVGVLYAELDDWEARIAEREVEMYDSDAARQRAEAARRRAEETHEAAFGAAEAARAVEPTADLRSLFREVARRVHPDFARNAADHAHHTRLMARANKAYARGDADALQRILDDFHEENSTSAEDQLDDDENAAAELARLDRQIAHAQRDIAAIEEELRSLPQNEIAQLKVDAEAASLQGRDLLAELAATLRERLADAEYRFHFLARQMNASR
jgi:hypothetical protein